MAFTLIENLFNDQLTSAVAEDNLVCVKFKSGIEYVGKLKYLDKGTYEMSDVLEAVLSQPFRTVLLRVACVSNSHSKLYFSVSDLLGVPPVTVHVSERYSEVASRELGVRNAT